MSKVPNFIYKLQQMIEEFLHENKSTMKENELDAVSMVNIATQDALDTYNLSPLVHTSTDATSTEKEDI